MNIGVARPSADELTAATHHFIDCRSIHHPYNVFTYQQDALATVMDLFNRYDTLVAVGGSGLYIEALCHGISLLPDPSPELRAQLQQKLRDEGVESLQQMLLALDPEYYRQVDLSNGIRLQRALEVCLTTGKPYSQVIHQTLAPRPFHIKPIVMERSRDELRQRIHDRVADMLQQGLEHEAASLFPHRHLTPLNTVGYKEFFALWHDRPTPLSLQQQQQVASSISLNTWHYAKKQLTWLKKFHTSLQ